MLIAIDTATDQASLALHDGFRVRMEYTWEAPRRHTSELTPRLADAIEQLDLAPKQLSGVAVTKGPGSFTGLRIGLSVAKGLAVAQSLPLVGIPTLDVVAAAQGRDRRQLAAILQAGRGRISIAIYRWQFGGWQAQEEPRLTTWADLEREITEPTLFCGEVDKRGADVIARLGDRAVLLPPAWRLRRAGFLAELGWRRLNQGDVDDVASLTPIYLKHPV
ncbi:MAG: tRNA (adenosine(37)-N6)-threonylcarbamoyltransferase complex dimerization subunit type 1 TsaB [Anaerolineae bacterium]|jgi:tRNA threonylcarbamoyladenosine biosynthesis protein TsaB